MTRPSRCDRVMMSWSSRRGLVVEERHREERLVRWVLRWQRLRRIRTGQRPERGVVERLDGARADNWEIADRAVLVDGERDDDVAPHRHRGIGDEPVALHLRDEGGKPGPELHALRVELV